MKTLIPNQNRLHHFARLFVAGLAALIPLLAASSRANTYSIVHEFAENSAGYNPVGGLVQDVGGVLYGTTSRGGLFDYGTVFRINRDGSGYSVLHHFTGSDGSGPYSTLLLCSNTLYGTTPLSFTSFGGTVYKVNLDGSGFAVLRDFANSANGTNGAVPYGGLVLLGNTLYGTTEYSRVLSGGASGDGTVFKLEIDGSGYTVIKSFTGADGSGPRGTLLLSGTTLYGTTWGGGGMPNCNCGTVFKIDVDGTSFASLNTFLITNGSVPFAGLALSGNTLYGTTLMGGDPGSYLGGTVFKLNTDGTGFAVLKAFTGDGVAPQAALTCVGTVLYGTTFNTSLNGPDRSGPGSLFRINTDGTGFTILKRFSTSDGANPCSELLWTGQTLFGTTLSGGSSNNGVIFALSLEPASLLGPLATQTAEVGSTVTFYARAGGDPPLVFQWLFNGTNVLAVGTSSRLELANVQPAQAGAYSVVVSNTFSTVVSSSAILSVIPAVERRTVPALTLHGQAGASLRVETTANLGPATTWFPLDTVSLTNPPQLYFDLASPSSQQSFYRARQTEPLFPPPMLQLNLVPAITLTNSVGSKVRLDYIQQFGPTDAWQPLATITIDTNPQLYFDTSVIGQPPRLYRLAPVP
jgi:uncharacterized repeat protein (TIGR03803 family)